MRSRNIKPGFYTNADLLECEPLARILFTGLWGLADREGRLEDRPKQIKISLLPCDNCDVDALLGQLEARNFIARYKVGEARYILVLNFAKHQNPHVREPASTIPAPDKPGARPARAKAKPKPARPLTDSPSLNPDPLNLNPHPAADALPAWLPVTQWNAWVEMRKKKDKAAFTKLAQELAVNALDKLRLQGHDPTAMLNEAIMKSWKSFYPPKENAHATSRNPSGFTRQPTKADRLRSAIRTAAEAGGYAFDERPEGEAAAVNDAGPVL